MTQTYEETGAAGGWSSTDEAGVMMTECSESPDGSGAEHPISKINNNRMDRNLYFLINMNLFSMRFTYYIIVIHEKQELINLSLSGTWKPQIMA
jgi:hypothetical protein